MNFKEVLFKIVAAFNENEINYALIGGFAMGLYGCNRTTIDLDFLVDKRDLQSLDEILTRHGYRCFHSTENVSQYSNPDSEFGEIDFIHAFRSVSLVMLEHKTEKEVYSGAVIIKVLLPEDIIGLKLQALKNDQSHRAVDIDDIKYLISNEKNIDMEVIKKYAKILDMVDIMDDLINESKIE